MSVFIDLREGFFFLRRSGLRRGVFGVLGQGAGRFVVVGFFRRMQFLGIVFYLELRFFQFKLEIIASFGVGRCDVGIAMWTVSVLLRIVRWKVVGVENFIFWVFFYNKEKFLIKLKNKNFTVFLLCDIFQERVVY